MKRLRVISTIFFLMLLFVFMGYSFAQTNWTKYGSPVLLSGSAGEWDDEGVGLSSVIYNGNTYKMWYSGWDGTHFRIGYATSPDGINWTKYNDPATVNPPYAESDPVLNLGPGSWENNWVYAQTVYFDGTNFRMWYIGNEVTTDRVGYATSPDGITWTKNGNPVINPGSSGSWDDAGIGPGPILFNGSTFELIYNGYDELHFQGGYATSPDGISWTKSADPILLYGQPGSWDNPRAQPGSVVFNSNTSKYYLFYSGGAQYNWRIGYATSSSFGGPWTKNPAILLDVTSGSWETNFIAFASVIEDSGSNLYKMWYSSQTTSGPYGIGYATADVVIPVELTSFIAEALDQKVLLKWSTATELNNNGFEIQRKVAESDFATIGFVKGEGTTTDQKEYSFTDKDLINGKYFYRLKQVDYNGTYEYSYVIEVDVRTLDEFALEQNFPNPFNPTTTIGYVLKEKSSTNLILLNAIGEEVAVLVNEEQDKGFHKVDFNAVNLSSGVYFYRLQAGSFVQTRKMILLK